MVTAVGPAFENAGAAQFVNGVIRPVALWDVRVFSPLRICRILSLCL
jgi:hypothetical protein